MGWVDLIVEWSKWISILKPPSKNQHLKIPKTIKHISQTTPKTANPLPYTKPPLLTYINLLGDLMLQQQFLVRGSCILMPARSLVHVCHEQTCPTAVHLVRKFSGDDGKLGENGGRMEF